MDSAVNNIENAKQKIRNRVEALHGERQANIDSNISKNLNESKATRQKVFQNGAQLTNLTNNVDDLGHDVNSIDGNLKAFRVEGQQLGQNVDAIGQNLQKFRSEVGNTQQAYSQGYRDAMSQMWSAVPPTLGEMMQSALYRMGIENAYKSESGSDDVLEPGSMLTFYHFLRAGWPTCNF